MFSIPSNSSTNPSKYQIHVERISKIMPIMNSYNWKEISFLSHKKDRKKFESND